MSHQHAVFWTASAAWVLGTEVCAGFYPQCVSHCSSVTLRVSPYTQHPWSMKGKCSKLSLWETIIPETELLPTPLALMLSWVWNTARVLPSSPCGGTVGEELELPFFHPSSTPFVDFHPLPCVIRPWKSNKNFLLNYSFGVLGWEKDLWSTEARPTLRYCQNGLEEWLSHQGRLTTKIIRYCQKAEPLSASLQVYCGAWLSFPGHSVLVGWIHGTVWPCSSFGNIKPGVSVSCHVLLGEDIAHIRHTVIVYLWFQRVSDIKQGTSDAAILGWSESSGRAGSHPVDFVFPRLPCGSQRCYFLGMLLLLGLRTCFVAEFPPSATRLFYHSPPLTGATLTTVGNAVDGEPQYYIEMR